MVSLFKTYNTREEEGKIYNVVELRGLSSDTKPTVIDEVNNIDNGSVFIEMDTQAIYMYDNTAETGGWVTPE